MSKTSSWAPSSYSSTVSNPYVKLDTDDKAIRQEITLNELTDSQPAKFAGTITGLFWTDINGQKSANVHCQCE